MLDCFWIFVVVWALSYVQARLGILRHGRPPRQERGILRHGIQRNGRKKLFMRNDSREWPIHNASPTAWIGSIVKEIWCLEVELRLVVHGMGTLRHFSKKKIFELDFFNNCFSSKVDDKKPPTAWIWVIYIDFYIDFMLFCTFKVVHATYHLFFR